LKGTEETAAVRSAKVKMATLFL